jgi:hypothetical protein
LSDPADGGTADGHDILRVLGELVTASRALRKQVEDAIPIVERLSEDSNRPCCAFNRWSPPCWSS